MDFDDNLPSRGADPLSMLIKQDLDPLSVSELETRIDLLAAEILRCKSKIEFASNHRSAADQLFKK
jgi:uncharacterized small protein (DUF1192 family)